MKTLICSITLIAQISAATVHADTWTWSPISNGNTLNAHLARCNFARPNPMDVFPMITDLQKYMIAPAKGLSAPPS